MNKHRVSVHQCTCRYKQHVSWTGCLQRPSNLKISNWKLISVRHFTVTVSSKLFCWCNKGRWKSPLKNQVQTISDRLQWSQTLRLPLRPQTEVTFYSKALNRWTIGLSIPTIIYPAMIYGTRLMVTHRLKWLLKAGTHQLWGLLISPHSFECDDHDAHWWSLGLEQCSMNS